MNPPGAGGSYPGDIPDRGATVWGRPLDWILPTPVPARYRLVPDGERRWRGIGAVHLWLLGFTARKAWVAALSDDPVTVGHLRDEVAPDVDECRLAVGVLRRRLMAARDHQDMLSGRTAMQAR